MRDKLAAVLGGLTVAEITPPTGLESHEFEPRTIGPWQTWPVWISSTWVSRCGITHSWHQLITLPAGDVATWTPAADALINPAREALEKVAHVERAEPVTITAADSQSTMPALRFVITTPEGT